MNNNKRKRVVLSIQQKLEIVQKFEKGQSARALSTEYGIGYTTVIDLKKQKEKLLKFACSSDSTTALKRRKTMKKSTYEDLDKALLEWFNNQRAQGTPINGPICAAKAKEFFNSLGLEGPFEASSGWLTRFKQRHGIRELDIQGEKLSGNIAAAEEFCNEFNRFVTEENLLPDQIFNVDETGLYWKCLPTTTLAAENEKNAPGYKASKDRITVMCCSNVSGTHKSKLVVIGKAKKPRSFKGSRATNLPVYYYGQKKGWMNKDIFHDWFHKQFCPDVRDFLTSNNLPQKAILVLDNAPSHPHESQLKSADGNISVKYLPPNVTALIQPMDQGVIANLKRHYRSSVLKNLVDMGGNLKEFFLNNNFTILDAIYECVAAWGKIKPSTLTKSWRKILPDVSLDDDFQGFECDDDAAGLATLARSLPGGEKVSEEDIDEWLNIDRDLPAVEVLSDEEILRRAQGIDSESGSEEEEEAVPAGPKVNYATARQYVEGLLDFMDGEDDSTVCDLMVLRKIRASILKKENGAKKQKTMKDYFC